MQCTPVNERIIVATLKTAITPLTIVQVYAPTDGSEADAKDAFYAQLQHQLGQIPEANMLLLMGDFNAKLGCQAEQWGGAIGRLGLPARITDNGRRLLTLCMEHSLAVVDTMFQHKTAHL